MSRLLQGDVGSGKTIIAIASLLIVIEKNLQGAFMVPTEVLAEQHYKNLLKYLDPLFVSVELLTGNTPQKKRKEIFSNLKNGLVDILVGTHALFEDKVIFNALGMVVIDEQHRFGVTQRNRLLNKGENTNLLSMTATPIPRTLALSIYGDLDVSQITELPPGRVPITTKIISEDDLTYSSNFLYMLTEKEQDPIAAKVFDRCLILHAEHSLNASTFSARVTASTLTDPYAVIASAVGTLAGPLHGGANEDVIAMLEEIKTPENAASFLDNAIKNKKKIMGFGHREYKVKDPRAIILQKLAEELFIRFGADEMYEVAKALKQRQYQDLDLRVYFLTWIFILVLFIENLVFLVICLLQFLPYLELLVG